MDHTLELLKSVKNDINILSFRLRTPGRKAPSLVERSSQAAYLKGLAYMTDNNELWPERLGPRPEAVFVTLNDEQQQLFVELRELINRARRDRDLGYDLVLNALFADDAFEGAGLAVSMWAAATQGIDPRDLSAHCYGTDGRILAVKFPDREPA